MSGWFRSRVAIMGVVASMVCVPLTQMGFGQSKLDRVSEADNSRLPSTQLSRVAATAGPDGVLLEWHTTFELDNVGFNVYRIQNGQRTQINQNIIAGSILIIGQGRPMYGGHSYIWFDSAGTVDCTYEIEDVGLSGKPGLHGLVKPIASDAPQMRSGPWQVGAGSTSEAASQQREWSGATYPMMSPAAMGTIADQWAIAALPALKIAVKTNDWYRVTQPQMVTAGFNVSADAHNLRMFSGARELPIRVSRDTGALGAADYVEFYGTGLDTPTTDTQIYYLVNGTQAGLRIPRVGEGRPDDKKPPVKEPSSKLRNHAVSSVEVAAAPNFVSTVQLKERTVYYSSLNNGDTENFFGKVISGFCTPPNCPAPGAQHVLTLSNVETTAAGPAQLRVAVQGASFHPHQTNVVLNGHAVGSLSFFGQENVVQTFPVPVSWLVEGNNNVTLSDGTLASNLVLVDYIQVTYPRSFVARNNSLRFSLRYSQGARVDGFTTSSIRVLDITDPMAVREVRPIIAASGPGFAATVPAFDNVTKGLRTLLAIPANGTSTSQSALVLNQPSSWNLNTNGASLLIISHQNFMTPLAPLVTQRQAQGYTVVPASAGGALGIVNIEDIYDEFSYGLHTPQAITDFVARARATWATPPQYLLLVGDASFDYRNYEGWGNLDFVPTRMIDTVFMETMSDDVMIDSNDDGIAEIPIGRLPVRTVAEANTMVAKIVNFSPAAQIPTVMMVADTQGTYYFNFEAASDELATVIHNLVPSTTIQQVYRRLQPSDAAALQTITNNINSGVAIVNYSGHGNVDTWGSNGAFFTAQNAQAVTNGNHLPVVIVNDCLNGYFADPGLEGIAEAFLKNPNGGSVASFSSSGETIPDGQHEMATQLYTLLYGAQPITIGDAIHQSKAATTDLDVRRTWILLGDPTLKIR